MKQVTYNYPAVSVNGVAATQSWTTATGAYVVLNGAYSQQVQGTVDPSQRYAEFPGIQRGLSISSTGNLSGVVFYASGVDTRGAVVTASFIGASGGSTSASDTFATIVGEWNRVNYIFATSAATSPFTIGTGATGSTRWYTTETWDSPFNTSVAVITSTGLAITIQDTPNNPNFTASPTVFSHATLVGVTANQQSNYAFPVSYIRGIVTTGTGAAATVAQVVIQQAGV